MRIVKSSNGKSFLGFNIVAHFSSEYNEEAVRVARAIRENNENGTNNPVDTTRLESLRARDAALEGPATRESFNQALGIQPYNGESSRRLSIDSEKSTRSIESTSSKESTCIQESITNNTSSTNNTSTTNNTSGTNNTSSTNNTATTNHSSIINNSSSINNTSTNNITSSTENTSNIDSTSSTNNISSTNNTFNNHSEVDNHDDLYGTSNPLDQFELRDLININVPILYNIGLSLTNIALYIIISFLIITALYFATDYSKKLIYSNWVLSKETLYDTIHGIVTSQINKFTGQVYFPFIYTLFLFILINNLIGLVPYSFATTSHFVLTFSLSFTIVLGATLLGFNIHNLKFFSLFVPSGCPLALLPILVLIEFISYLARNVSLGLRLAANILSGHMLLNILSGFTYKIMNTNILFFILGLLPLSFIIAFSSLEIGIAFIQAQVFVVLTCSYVKDCLNLH